MTKRESDMVLGMGTCGAMVPKWNDAPRVRL